jgi:hypothetical protein
LVASNDLMGRNHSTDSQDALRNSPGWRKTGFSEKRWLSTDSFCFLETVVVLKAL